MHKILISVVLVLILATKSFGQEKENIEILSVPGVSEYTKINIGGKTVLPSGRLISPSGETIQITNDPFGLAVSPDGNKLLTLHNGVFTLIDRASLKQVRIPSYDGMIKSPLSNGSFLGVDFSADSKLVYLSGGDNGAVLVYDIEKFERIDSISLNGTINGVDFGDSFTSDLKLLPERNELLVLDRANFRMVKIDLSTKKLTSFAYTGRQPFSLTLTPDHKTAFVANVGMYSYPIIPDITKENYDSMLLPFHPYGDNTPQSIYGYKLNGRMIPGVGSPLAKQAMSVYQFDLSSFKEVAFYKTGFQIGQMLEQGKVVGGASPNSIEAGKDFIYVSNATNDAITKIDYHAHKIISNFRIRVSNDIDKYRGLLPFGMALSKDEKTLYVALLGFNAIAVVDVAHQITKGLIPTGWGPTKLKLSNDNKEIYVTTCRGYGAGPNGGKDFIKPVQGTYIGDIQLGSFQKIQNPEPAQLMIYTKEAIDNTYVKSKIEYDPHHPLPVLPNIGSSPIKYIVYITKENRTYDEVMGQLSSGRGDSYLARFGRNVTVSNKNDTLRNVNVSPNHLKIAEDFCFSDNFYCDSDASIHGHHWMLGVIPNEWVEANSSVDKTALIFSHAPGRRFPGSTGSMDPEDYAETGGLWEAMERSHVSFFNFGEANETAHVREEWMDTATGASHAVMVPMQNALYKRTSHAYAGFNTNIPDQFRVEQFEKEFTRLWLKGKAKMPSLVTIQLPNDHTAKERPEDGYKYRHSYVADNDLALGRMIQFLSHTPYWKNMLVIITEDDPQGGVDHVDAHRSILMMAGPYVKRGYTSHKHANFGSILKVIYNILHVPYVNQYDATASLLDDMFTSTADYKPYSFVMPSRSVFDPAQSMKRYNRNIDWVKIKKDAEMDDEDDQRKDHYGNED